MSCIECICGAKYDRIASHKNRVLGFQCSECRRNWRTKVVVNPDKQMQLWFRYYECTCGSNTLNIPPKNQYCICEVGELR